MSGKEPALVVPPLSRVDRAAGRMLRERERKARVGIRRRPTRAQVDAHAALIAKLTEAHKTPFERIDWAGIVAQGPVVPAVARDAVSSAARRRLAEYRPSMMDTLLGLEQKKRRELTAKVLEAGRADVELYARAKAEAEAHNRLLKLAPEVGALTPSTLAGVLKANGAAEALKDLVEGLSLHLVAPGRLVLQLDLLEFEALPDEACIAGAAGPAYVEIPIKERLELQLANACSVVLRAAVELLQAAPVDAVEVLARRCTLDGQTEADLEPVLHLKVAAAVLAKLKLPQLEAAPVIMALQPRVDWNPARGFAPIPADDLKLMPPRTPAAA